MFTYVHPTFKNCCMEEYNYNVHIASYVCIATDVISSCILAAVETVYIKMKRYIAMKVFSQWHYTVMYAFCVDSITTILATHNYVYKVVTCSNWLLDQLFKTM